MGTGGASVASGGLTWAPRQPEPGGHTGSSGETRMTVPAGPLLLLRPQTLRGRVSRLFTPLLPDRRLLPWAAPGASSPESGRWHLRGRRRGRLCGPCTPEPTEAQDAPASGGLCGPPRSVAMRCCPQGGVVTAEGAEPAPPRRGRVQACGVGGREGRRCTRASVGRAGAGGPKETGQRGCETESRLPCVGTGDGLHVSCPGLGRLGLGQPLLSGQGDPLA